MYTKILTDEHKSIKDLIFKKKTNAPKNTIYVKKMNELNKFEKKWNSNKYGDKNWNKLNMKKLNDYVNKNYYNRIKNKTLHIKNNISKKNNNKPKKIKLDYHLNGSLETINLNINKNSESEWIKKLLKSINSKSYKFTYKNYELLLLKENSGNKNILNYYKKLISCKNIIKIYYIIKFDSHIFYLIDNLNLTFYEYARKDDNFLNKIFMDLYSALNCAYSHKIYFIKFNLGNFFFKKNGDVVLYGGDLVHQDDLDTGIINEINKENLKLFTIFYNYKYDTSLNKFDDRHIRILKNSEDSLDKTILQLYSIIIKY